MLSYLRTRILLTKLAGKVDKIPLSVILPRLPEVSRRTSTLSALSKREEGGRRLLGGALGRGLRVVSNKKFDPVYNVPKGAPLNVRRKMDAAEDAAEDLIFLGTRKKPYLDLSTKVGPPASIRRRAMSEAQKEISYDGIAATVKAHPAEFKKVQEKFMADLKKVKADLKKAKVDELKADFPAPAKFTTAEKSVAGLAALAGTGVLARSLMKARKAKRLKPTKRNRKKLIAGTTGAGAASLLAYLGLRKGEK